MVQSHAKAKYAAAGITINPAAIAPASTECSAIRAVIGLEETQRSADWNHVEVAPKQAPSKPAAQANAHNWAAVIGWPAASIASRRARNCASHQTRPESGMEVAARISCPAAPISMATRATSEQSGQPSTWA